MPVLRSCLLSESVTVVISKTQKKNGLNFTAVSLRSLLNNSLVWSVFEKHGSGLVLFCFIFGGNENKEKYSRIVFVCFNWWS